jgi:hypothetical protein
MGLGGDQSDDTAPEAGAAYAYSLTTTWSFTEYLKASNPSIGDAFGESTAVSANGGVLVIGASSANTARGSIYVVE